MSGAQSFGFMIVGMPWVIAVRGGVLARLWLWFVVPALGVRPISGAVAIGLAMLANVVLSPSDGSSKSEQKPIGFLFLEGIAQSGVALAFGWLIHLLV